VICVGNYWKVNGVEYSDDDSVEYEDIEHIQK
jgi:hypothetical protein